MAKKRLDVLLVDKGYFESREKAKAHVMAGLIMIDDRVIDKVGEKVEEDSHIEVKGKAIPYVSRGGLKLERALEVFPVSVSGKSAIDIGASTGGFTDCLLQNGAQKVWAIDVGYGQLAWKLRQDERVVVMERTNIRHVTVEDIGEPVALIVTDVSFISLHKVLPAAFDLLKEDGEIICLIKPQFEAGPGKVGKKGIVRDPSVHHEVIKNITEFVAESGYGIGGLNHSPVKGTKGNIEYLLYIVPLSKGMDINEETIEAWVKKAHKSLD